MTDARSLAGLAHLLADPTRAGVCLALLDGRAWTAGELARASGVAPSTMSAHLDLLVEGGLLTQERQGRHRYLRLADARTATLVEGLAAHTAPAPVPTGSLRVVSAHRALLDARTCYDHLAGRLGVAVTEALVSQRALRRTDGGFEVTPSGRSLVEGIGVDLEGARRRRRRFALACLDWTERRSHLGGALGAAICDRFVELGWVRRRPAGRAVLLTDHGAKGLAGLGIELESDA